MKKLENILGGLFTVLAPTQTMALTALLLVLVDLLTGLVAARKQGNVITSNGLKRTVLKLVVYELLICLAYLTDTYLTKGVTLTILPLVTGVIGIGEIKSVTENLSIITGDDVISRLLSTISSQDKDPKP